MQAVIYSNMFVILCPCCTEYLKYDTAIADHQYTTDMFIFILCLEYALVG